MSATIKIRLKLSKHVQLKENNLIKVLRSLSQEKGKHLVIRSLIIKTKLIKLREFKLFTKGINSKIDFFQFNFNKKTRLQQKYYRSLSKILSEFIKNIIGVYHCFKCYRSLSLVNQMRIK